ncbi:DUF1819 family protein [Pumilibacter muris]|uniref:DUF1819 family protein n=1 Tax=Pumilibacter muris TaxID=2941510 RepID=UPI0020424DB7|nr:DUF1819 family protein [Pumilibacter muris]
MNKKIYSSSIKKTPFKYSISKKIAKLMIDGKGRQEVFDECYVRNYIEVESIDRRKEISNVIYSRLINIDEFLLKQFYEGDVETSKFILVYAIAKSDMLFFDFMFEIYREALVGNKDYISIDDFDNFFAAKKETDLIVASWGHYTMIQLAKGYRNILVDSGMGERDKRNIKAIKLMIHPAVQDYIRQIGDAEYLKALLGEC